VEVVHSGNRLRSEGKDHVAFGKTPRDGLFEISPDYASGGPGQVCFFTGRNTRK
jgi:hypothetical protein